MELSIFTQFLLVLPEILLVFSAIAVMLLPRTARKLAWEMTASNMFLAAVIESQAWVLHSDILGGIYRIDEFSVFAKVMLLVLGFICVLGSYDFTYGLAKSREYYALLSTAMLGLLIVPSATDYITLFIAFELISVATYVLPMIDPDNEGGLEATLKYFLSGAFSSAIILYGMSLLYGFTGTFDIDATAEVIGIVGLHPMLALALVLMLVGFGYKMALVPMHLWAADTYQGAPSATTGFISGVTQKGAFIVAMKLVLVTFAFEFTLASVLLGVLCVVTMTVGNVLALLQKDVKRMLAYSSVAHAGNIPVGIAVGTAMGVAGSFLHILAHGLMTIGAFFIVRQVAIRKGGTKLADFAGLARQMPWLSAAFVVILLSYGGIPPLLGFWSKMLMVVAAVGQGGWYTALAVVLVLNSALSLVYYARVIRDMYAKEPQSALLPVYDPNTCCADRDCDECEKCEYDYRVFVWRVAIFLSAALLLVLGLFPNILTEWAVAAASALMW